MYRSSNSTDVSRVENVGNILLCAAVTNIPELMNNYTKKLNKHSKDCILALKSVMATNNHMQDTYKALLNE